VEIGFCDTAGACAEGTVGSRRQCEPIADTPAFDRATHRWTGRTHEGRGLFGGGDESEGEGESESESESSPGEASPSGGACAGCAVPRGGAPGAIVLVALAGLALHARRRRG
jgi:MYXO-CTERM domain-containing protein